MLSNSGDVVIQSIHSDHPLQSLVMQNIKLRLEVKILELRRFEKVNPFHTVFVPNLRGIGEWQLSFEFGG